MKYVRWRTMDAGGGAVDFVVDVVVVVVDVVVDAS